MGKAKTENIEISYEVRGSGEALVLIGGYTMVKESWGLLIPELSKHFRVVSFDSRGAGETTGPDESFTIADMAKDTVGLLDSLSIESAHFFGVSMGGLIAQTLALDFPDRVKKAALGCTTHGGKQAVQPDEKVMAVLAQSADPTLLPEESIRQGLPILFSERFLKEETNRIEGFVQHALSYLPTPKGAAGQMKALSFFNVKARLGEIRCPVLVITGSEDCMMPPENSKLLAQGIPNAELHIVQGTGHNFFFEKPAEVNRVLIDFFKK